MNVSEAFADCVDSRPCFGKSTYHPGKCTVLVQGYDHDGECPFCKPKREWTKGKRYPHRNEVEREKRIAEKVGGKTHRI